VRRVGRAVMSPTVSLAAAPAGLFLETDVIERPGRSGRER
jgi:hypothetical protein